MKPLRIRVVGGSLAGLPTHFQLMSRPAQPTISEYAINSKLFPQL